MTITVLPSRNEYTATAAQAVFNYTFKIFASTDLTVYVTSAGEECDDTADITTAYTVSGVGLEGGGAITLTTPSTLGDLVTIVSSIPASRTTDYQVNGDFRSPVVNDDFDRVVSLVKQVEDLGNRSILTPECQQGPKPLTLAAPSANDILRWKNDLTGLENVAPDTILPGSLVSTDFDKSHDNVAAMIADASLVVGQAVVTGGYTTKGDGGGNRYNIVAAGTGVDDGGLFIDLSGSSLQAKGIFLNNTAHVKQYGVIGDNVSDDSTAITNLFASGMGIVADNGLTFKVSGLFTILANTSMRMNGARFSLSATATADTTVVGVLADCIIDNLSLDIPTGIDVDRVFTLSGDNTFCNLIEVVSVDQQDNRSDADNAAIRILGDNVTIIRQRVEKFDNGTLWRCTGLKATYTNVESYVRGCWLDTVSFSTFDTIEAKVRSANATGDPGHNGALIRSCDNVYGKQIVALNAGEHGVRFGGDPGNTNIRIGQIHSELSGATGVKFRCSSNSLNEHIAVDSIICIDSGDPVNPISNQEGVILERLSNAHFGYIEVRKIANAKSCHSGVSSYNASFITIGSFNISDTNNDMFSFETDGVDDDSNPESKDINSFIVNGGIGDNIDRHGVLVDFGDGSVRDMHFGTACHIQDVGGDLINAQGAGSGTFANDCVFGFTCRVISGTPINGAKISNNVMLNLTAPHTATTGPAKGSRWHDLSTNNYLIKDSAGTWRALNT